MLPSAPSFRSHLCRWRRHGRRARVVVAGRRAGECGCVCRSRSSSPRIGDRHRDLDGLKSAWGASSSRNRPYPTAPVSLARDCGGWPKTGQAIRNADAAGVKRIRQLGQQAWVMSDPFGREELALVRSDRQSRSALAGQFASAPRAGTVHHRVRPVRCYRARNTPGGAPRRTPAGHLRIHSDTHHVDRRRSRAGAPREAQSASRRPLGRRLAVDAGALVLPPLGVGIVTRDRRAAASHEFDWAIRCRV